MSDVLECALALAAQKVRFFPVKSNSKFPAVTNFSGVATSEEWQLESLFCGNDFNGGIACGKIAEDLYLVGFDIDKKAGRDGFETLEFLAECDLTFPATWSQRTPSGGEHRLFYSRTPILQGVNVFGKDSGIDLRGDGGYLVAPGSVIDGKQYEVIADLPIAFFPEWACTKFAKKTAPALPATKTAPVENQDLALRQSVSYLQSLPTVYEGARSHNCFKVVAQLKDLGLSQHIVLPTLLEHWRCEPMLEVGELNFTIGNTYRYGKNAVGAKAPENMFSVVEEEPPPRSALEVLNDNHFYYASEGVTRVCEETMRDGRFHLERYPVANFHENHLSEKIPDRGKERALTRVWLEWAGCRKYKYLRFDPSNQLPPEAYNTWHGFAVAPAVDAAIHRDPRAQQGVDLFLEHCRENICRGNESLFNWLMDFMADIFQNPGEKPEVSLVFRGDKGTGKTAVSEILGHLIGDNAVSLSDKTHALGHFNSVMEDKILVTLEEAFWSGDRNVEGILKDIVTGRTRVITYKGAEPYTARVFDRIIIIGNDEWAVPASADERRFAVFEVGDDRQQDRKFFGAMKNGLFKHGGDQLLMRFFLNRDLSKAEVNVAPMTEGLDGQKLRSLNIFGQWWLHCLEEGQLMGSGLPEWPTSVSCNDFYAAFLLQMQNERYRGHIPSRISTGMQFKRLAKSVGGAKNKNGNTKYYEFPSLEILREDMERQLKLSRRKKWE